MKLYNYYIYDPTTDRFKCYTITRKQFISFFDIHVKFKIQNTKFKDN